MLRLPRTDLCGKKGHSGFQGWGDAAYLNRSPSFRCACQSANALASAASGMLCAADTPACADSPADSLHADHAHPPPPGLSPPAHTAVAPSLTVSSKPPASLVVCQQRRYIAVRGACYGRFVGKGRSSGALRGCLCSVTLRSKLRACGRTCRRRVTQHRYDPRCTLGLTLLHWRHCDLHHSAQRCRWAGFVGLLAAAGGSPWLDAEFVGSGTDGEVEGLRGG
jgi:hypothetical protein